MNLLSVLIRGVVILIILGLLLLSVTEEIVAQQGEATNGNNCLTVKDLILGVGVVVNNTDTTLQLAYCGKFPIDLAPHLKSPKDKWDVEGIWAKHECIPGQKFCPYKLGAGEWIISKSPELPPGYFYLSGIGRCQEVDGSHKSCGWKWDGYGPKDVKDQDQDGNTEEIRDEDKWERPGEINYVLLRKNVVHLVPINGYFYDSPQPDDPLPNCGDLEYDGLILFNEDQCKGLNKAFNQSVSATAPSSFTSSSIFVGNNWSAIVVDGAGHPRCISRSMWDLDIDYYPNTNIKIEGNLAGLLIYHNTNCGGSDINQDGTIDTNNGSTPVPGTTPNPGPTSTPLPSQRVELFGLANYQNSVWSGGPGFSNGPSHDSFSMKIPDGWSVKTWRGDNQGGEMRCWSASVPNLQDHGWHLAIEYIEIFSSNVCSSTNQKVKFFRLANYQDLLQSIGVGFSNEPNGNSFSMDIPGGWSVKTWRDDNRGGEERCWSESVANLQDHSWHLAIQSIEVFNTNVCIPTNGGVSLCRNTGLDNCVPVTSDLPSLGNAGIGNDDVESVKILGDGEIVLFWDDNYQGTYSVINGTDSNLSDNAIGNNNASSMRLRRRSPALFTLYELGDWNGPSFSSDRTITDLGHWNRNDWAKSIRVAPGYEVVVCGDSDFHGLCGRTKVDRGSMNSLVYGLVGNNGQGGSSVSSIRLCEGQCPPAPDIPILVSPANGVTVSPETSISFQWFGNGDKYAIEISGGALNSPITQGWMDSMQWNQSNLPASSNPYSWRVKAWNGYGESGWSLPVSFTVANNPPTATPTVTPNATNTPTSSPTFTATPTPVGNNSVELLSQSWHLVGNNGAAEKYQSISPNALQGRNMLRITYNLHGLTALGNDASAIIFDQGGSWRYISLSNYGLNGLDGTQIVDIPLSYFPGLNPNNSVGTLHTRFWYSGPFTVDVTSIVAYTSQNGTPTPQAPTATPTVIATSTSTPIPTSTSTPTFTPVPTNTPTTISQPTNTSTPSSNSNEVELLSQVWHLVGNNGAAEKYQNISSNVLQGRNMLRITYNLHGLTALGNDASAIIFDQGGSWRYISLSNYGQNGLDGQQTVNIPLANFPGLNLNQSVGTLHTRFWYGSSFTVDITSIVAYSSQNGTPTPAQTNTPAASATATSTSVPTNTPTAIPTATSTLPPTPTFTSVPTATPVPPTPTNTSTATPPPTNTPLPSPTPTSSVGEIELLSQPWNLIGNNGATEKYQNINANALQGRNKLRITYNLHGLNALGGDASAIIFDQGGSWRYISLSNYGQNGLDGQQTVDISLADFPGLNPNNSVGTLHTRFWYSGSFTVDITSIVAYNSQN